MKNIRDVLREKEAELRQLEKEIEALRLAVNLLDDQPHMRSGHAGWGPWLEASSLVAGGDVAADAGPKVLVSTPYFEEHSDEAAVSVTAASRQFP